jgi:hypothetical protein
MKLLTLTQYTLQAAVRVPSIDLKKFDRAGGRQQYQKTRFLLDFHYRFCLYLIPDLMLSPKRQDPNLSRNEHQI